MIFTQKVFNHLTWSPGSDDLIADVSGDMRDTPVAVAYATEGYDQALNNLKKDCEQHFLGGIFMKHVRIMGRDEVPIRRLATHLKSHFIEWCLRTFNRPVWYFDADTRLKAAPPEIESKYWGAFHRQPSRDKLGFPVRSSMFFLRPHSATFEFLKSWHGHHKPEHEDHTPLCKAWREFQRYHHDKCGMLDSDFSKWAQCDGTKVKSNR